MLSAVKAHLEHRVPLRSLNVSLITHLQYLVLTCAFFPAELNILSLFPDWLTVCSACLPPLSLQRPWVSSWPVVVPHPDTASSKSSQGCASTAVTQTYVTAPPPGIPAHSTTSVRYSASCCWGCGCDMESFGEEQNTIGLWEKRFVPVTLIASLSCSCLAGWDSVWGYRWAPWNCSFCQSQTTFQTTHWICSIKIRPTLSWWGHEGIYCAHPLTQI